MLIHDKSVLRGQAAEAALSVVERPGTTLGEMSKHFPDPRDLFIASPQPISVRDLAAVYLPDDDSGTYIGDLRKRHRQERWQEARALFQAKRSAGRMDAIIEAEATVWSMLGVDFHMSRARSLWSRWEMLSASVEDGLSKIESGKGMFTSGLRDMSRELREVEGELAAIMPKLGLTEKAQRAWTGRAESRGELVDRIENKLRMVASGDAGRGLFEVIEGGLDQAEDDIGEI
jgi:hypothetical protein